VLTEADLRRCAAVMIERYGPRAATRALLRATDLYDQGDRDAAEIWMQVRARIERLQAEKPAPGDTVQ
jgi:hypothetical protein